MDIVYLDNSATTKPHAEVINEVSECILVPNGQARVQACGLRLLLVFLSPNLPLFHLS